MNFLIAFLFFSAVCYGVYKFAEFKTGPSNQG